MFKLPEISESIPFAAEVTLLDYGGGNVRSIRNAIRLLGFNIRDVRFSEAGIGVFSNRRYSAIILGASSRVLGVTV